MTARWRPKTQKQILQLNEDEGSRSPVVTVVQTDSPAPASNKLHALLGHYNSDDDDDDDDETEKEAVSAPDSTAGKAESAIPTNSVWQELWDPGSGHPYYWNPLTNELTWEKPAELLKPPKQSKVNTETQLDKPQIQQPLMYPTILSSVEELPPPAADFKISFKLAAADKSKKVEEPAKKVPSVDIDLIIADIEKEIPPDCKTRNEPFIPLFKRRKMDNGTTKSTLLNFKNYFRPSRSDSLLPLIEEPILEDARNPNIVNNHRGLGFHESSPEAESKPEAKEEKIQFIKGETLVPMVVPEPAPKLEEKVLRLRKELEAGSPNLYILNALDEAWNLKKLDEEYFEFWVDRNILHLEEKNVCNEEPKQTVVESKEEDQVIDMVLDDSASESSLSDPPAILSEGTNTADMLDSALDSFYSDLATLDAAPSVSEQHALAGSNEPNTEDPVGAVQVQETSADLSKRTIKRSKMSQDMSSLVAKWQKINQSGKS